ncbi:hypothetical protein Nepgr_023207 [Nepenthes gracilis]|uniref:Uncharacterized protein n=1 Tax=Nepenthes gracilis TaxID=150966 RepID=A0AAD3T0U0_NEPGR|nr:hypothetical protein Nepgr_023207 [Nepenthes gracilis]
MLKDAGVALLDAIDPALRWGFLRFADASVRKLGHMVIVLWASVDAHCYLVSPKGSRGRCISIPIAGHQLPCGYGGFPLLCDACLGMLHAEGAGLGVLSLVWWMVPLFLGWSHMPKCIDLRCLTRSRLADR